MLAGGYEPILRMNKDISGVRVHEFFSRDAWVWYREYRRNVVVL